MRNAEVRHSTAEKIARQLQKLLAQEAVRVVSGSPRWPPGRQEGRAVRVRFMLPLDFTIPR